MSDEDSEILWRDMPMWIGFRDWYSTYHGAARSKQTRMDVYFSVHGVPLYHIPVKWWLN